MEPKIAEANNDTAATGIAGLDEVLLGGLPRGSMYLVQGSSGVGKTTLSFQFLFAGRDAGETTLYVTLSESREEVEVIARSHGWSLEGLSLYELSAIEARLHPDATQTMFHPAELELEEAIKPILNEIERLKPTRAVIDSLSEIRLLARDPLRYRRQILALKQFFMGKNCTVLLLDDESSQWGDNLLQSIAHGVIVMEKRAPNYGPSRRRLTVEKLRGVGFIEGYHDYKIGKGGIAVYPRLVPSSPKQPTIRKDNFISSGIGPLDAMLGGGLDRGTSVLFMGPAGCGKSTLALRYCWATAERGQRCAIYNFDERAETVLKRAAALGMPLGKHLESGRIFLQHIDPAELSPGEFVNEVQRRAEKDGGLVLIDSINGYLYSMPDEDSLMLQLHELFTHLGQRGVTSLLTLAQHGMVASMMPAPVDVSYLADTAFVLRFFEARGRIRRALSVTKRRAGLHESTIRELQFGNGAITIGQPLVEFEGVLTGVPKYIGGHGPLLPYGSDGEERRR